MEPIIKFKSVDKVKRTATFDVDGVTVTRKIPVKFKESIDEHIDALASGLAVEFNVSEAKVIEDTKYKKDEVLREPTLVEEAPVTK